MDCSGFLNTLTRQLILTTNKAKDVIARNRIFNTVAEAGVSDIYRTEPSSFIIPNDSRNKNRVADPCIQGVASPEPKAPC